MVTFYITMVKHLKRFAKNQCEYVCANLWLSFSIRELFYILILFVALSSSTWRVGDTLWLNKNKFTLSYFQTEQYDHYSGFIKFVVFLLFAIQFYSILFLLSTPPHPLTNYIFYKKILNWFLYGNNQLQWTTNRFVKNLSDFLYRDSFYLTDYYLCR